MKKGLLFLLLFQSSLIIAQTDLTDWEGEWRGELEIYNEKGLSQKLPMGLNIVKDNKGWKWQIIYNEGPKQDFRDYSLLPTANPNQFNLDENNGIILKLSLLHNTFQSVFEMGESILIVSYMLEKDLLVFRTLFSPVKNSIESGGQNENSMKVQARETTTYQIAYLKKS